MHSVCRCTLPVWRRSFLKKGTPRDLFWPRPGSAPGGIWPKNNNTCKGPWVLNPYQVSSKSIQRFWRRSRKCEKFTDGRTDGRRTDGRRTDDGRCAMTIAHSSLRLRWAKNTNLVEDIEIFLNYKFPLFPFSDIRGEVKMPQPIRGQGGHIFSDRPEKLKLG